LLSFLKNPLIYFYIVTVTLLVSVELAETDSLFRQAQEGRMIILYLSTINCESILTNLPMFRQTDNLSKTLFQKIIQSLQFTLTITFTATKTKISNSSDFLTLLVC